MDRSLEEIPDSRLKHITECDVCASEPGWGKKMAEELLRFRSRLSVQGEELPERPNLEELFDSPVFLVRTAVDHFAVLEAEIRRLKGERDDRDRHIAGAYSALGDVNRSIYLFDLIPSALSASRADALKEWRPIDTAPHDGTTILVDFGNSGVHAVAWEEAQGITIWAVDDCKHGPFPLRGYIESDVKGWMPLPDSSILARMEKAS